MDRFRSSVQREYLQTPSKGRQPAMQLRPERSPCAVSASWSPMLCQRAFQLHEGVSGKPIAQLAAACALARLNRLHSHVLEIVLGFDVRSCNKRDLILAGEGFILRFEFRFDVLV